MSHGARIILFSVLAVFCACSNKPENPAQSSICIDADALFAEANTTQVLIFPDAPGRATLVVSTPDPELTDFIYFVDLEGDGIFDVTGTTSELELLFAQTREYPIQVTGIRCRDEATLVARTNVFARAVSIPALLTQFEPDIAFPVQVNTLITARIRIVGSENNPPYRIVWSWGDGAEGELELDAAVAELQESHQYAVPGLYPFAVTVVDQNNLLVSQAETLILTVPAANAFSIDLGREFRDFSLFDPILSPADGEHVIVATGNSGVITLSVTGQTELVRVLARTDLDFPEGKPAERVEVDRANGVAYVGSSSHGIFLLDVTNATEPRTLFPTRIQVPDEVPNIQAMWYCENQQRLYFLNEGTGVYAIEVDTEILDDLRENPELNQSAWRLLREQAGDAGSTLLRLPHTKATGLSCLNDSLVFVADRTKVSVYDLESFFSGNGVSEIATLSPGVSLLSGSDLEISDLATPSQVTTNTFVMVVAMRHNGSAEYFAEITEGTVVFTLKKHRLRARKNSGFTDPLLSLTYEPHERVAASTQETFLAISGGQGSDPLFILDNTIFPSTLTKTMVYLPADICKAEVGKYSGQLLCQAGMGHRKLAFSNTTPPVSDAIWLSTAKTLKRYDRGAGIVTEFALPLSPNWIALRNNDYWLGAGRQLMIYDRHVVEAETTGMLQASPVWTISLPHSVFAVSPAGEADEYLLVGNGRISWMNATTDPEIVAELTVGYGIAEVAYDPALKLGAVVDTAARRVRVLERSGALVTTEFMSEQGGFGSVLVCGDDLLAWRQIDDQRLIYRYDVVANTLVQLSSHEAKPFGHVACNSQVIAVVQGNLGSRLELSLYNRETAEQLLDMELPISTGSDIRSIALRMTQNVLGLQVSARSTYLFDISDPGEPALFAADPFANVANGKAFTLLELPDMSIRYGVLVPAAGGRPPWFLVKKTL